MPPTALLGSCRRSDWTRSLGQLPRTRAHGGETMRALALFGSLFVLLAPVLGQYHHGRYDYQEPVRAGGNKFWGLMKNGMVTAVAGYGFGQFYYRWTQGRIKRAHEKRTEKLKTAYETSKEAIVTSFGEAYRNLEDNAEIIDKLIAQLEGVLHDPETDPSKRKLAEFKLPDSNNDDIISRQEFNAYLRSYFAAHPELADIEYPTFDDFDLNKDGSVTFAEWAEFIKKLEAEQEKAAENSARDYARRTG